MLQPITVGQKDKENRGDKVRRGTRIQTVPFVSYGAVKMVYLLPSLSR
jgi:hypothetical protein